MAEAERIQLPLLFYSRPPGSSRAHWRSVTLPEWRKILDSNQSGCYPGHRFRDGHLSRLGQSSVKWRPRQESNLPLPVLELDRTA